MTKEERKYIARRHEHLSKRFAALYEKHLDKKQVQTSAVFLAAQLLAMVSQLRAVAERGDL